MSRRFVVNASPLILLVRAEQLELLDLLADEVRVPQAVMEELRAGSDRDRAAVEVEGRDGIQVVPHLELPSEVQSWDLGAGESQVLVHARQDTELEAVLDDRAARRCASVLGVPCTGTVGVVLAGKRLGHLDAARPILARLRAEGMFLSDSLVETLLAEVGE